MIKTPTGVFIILFTVISFNTAAKNTTIDSFSLQCLSCHEKFSGTHNGRSNHPIGMLYKNSMLFGGYKEISDLAKSIQLPEGKISCISCHTRFNKQHGKQEMNNSKSELCFACHDI